jgi:L-ribulose-5-phosphate 4-epimerase
VLKELKAAVLAANKELPKRGLVLYSWGNVSGIDREKGMVVIKPAGFPYSEMTIDDLSVVNMDGNVIEGPHKPAVDLPTHLVLYQAFPGVNAIVHTHSTYATIWAQASCPIPCFGTTHADYFLGEVPCTRILTGDEVQGNYEEQTGNVIVESYRDRDPVHVPGVLVAQHGPFTWGEDVWEALHKSVVLEEIAKMAIGVLSIAPDQAPIQDYLLHQHFFRKQGPDAYFEHDDKRGKTLP